MLDNYVKWCKYLRIRPAWNRSLRKSAIFLNTWFFFFTAYMSGYLVYSFEAIDRDRKLFLVSLYFLIWGEAANVRFLPECICYIFHHVSFQLWSYIQSHFCSANPITFCNYFRFGSYSVILVCYGFLFFKFFHCGSAFREVASSITILYLFLPSFIIVGIWLKS